MYSSGTTKLYTVHTKQIFYQTFAVTLKQLKTSTHRKILIDQQANRPLRNGHLEELCTQQMQNFSLASKQKPAIHKRKTIQKGVNKLPLLPILPGYRINHSPPPPVPPPASILGRTEFNFCHDTDGPTPALGTGPIQQASLHGYYCYSVKYLEKKKC